MEKDLQLEPILPRAILEFESGMALMVDVRMRWEKATEPLAICISTPHNRSLTSFLPDITISPKKEVSLFF